MKDSPFDNGMLTPDFVAEGLERLLSSTDYPYEQIKVEGRQVLFSTAGGQIVSLQVALLDPARHPDMLTRTDVD
jgi:hypothetical protein